jgi:hypothetical protein
MSERQNLKLEDCLEVATCEKGKPAPLQATKRWRERANSRQNAHKKLLCVPGGEAKSRLLGPLLERDHHLGQARPESPKPPPMGEPPHP